MAKTEHPEAYITVRAASEGRYEEKKSVFLAELRPAASEEEALAFVEEKKKLHHDARHNCFAYVIGENADRVRAADDGEPQGTAGRPILDVLSGKKITNAVLVVTRYFGGVLLGTGGLARAYSAAAADAAEHAQLVQMVYGTRAEILTDYTDIGRLQYLLAQQGVQTCDSQYGEKVRLEVLFPQNGLERLRTALADATAGRASFSVLQHEYYPAE